MVDILSCYYYMISSIALLGKSVLPLQNKKTKSPFCSIMQDIWQEDTSLHTIESSGFNNF